MCAVCTLLAMTAQPGRSPDDGRYADVRQRWHDLSACAAGIIPTRIPLEPAPRHIEMVGEDLRLLARKVDALIAAYGDYVDAHAPGIDRALFQDVLFTAIDGNALYEVEQASQQLCHDDAERAYYARYNPLA
jgi:hypothetical protein